MKHSAVVAHTITPILGASTGLRTFTPLAVTAWFALAGKLRVKRTWAQWIAHPAAVGLLTTAAVGEFIGDTLPDTPDRTKPLPLLGRLACGGLAGAIIATAARRPIAGGVALGAIGAAAGTFAGFHARRGLTSGAGLPDLPVAISGDAAAVALAFCSLQQLTRS